MGKISCAVVDAWRRSPFTHAFDRREPSRSTPVAMHGPIGRERVEALAARVLRFLVLHVARRDVVEAGEAEHVVPGPRSRTRCARSAMTTASSASWSTRPTPGGSLIGAPGSSTAVDGLMNKQRLGRQRLS